MAKLTATFQDVTADMQEAMKYEHDGRQKSREADHFINKRDGQWEPDVVKLFNGQPRYTIDLTSGIVNDAHGEMSSMDFAIKVSPSGGPATNAIAQHYAGLMRNIENNSGVGAKYIYRAAAKQMLTGGLGGWGIKQGYRSPMSFDQDLMIYPISNFMDRVWLDPGAEEQTGEDANWGFKLTSMSNQDYKRDFPKGSGMSVGRDLEDNVYSYKKSNAVVVAERYWKKFETVELLRMTDGAVFINDEKFKKVKDELKAKGVTVDKARKTKVARIFHQFMDGNDFLGEETETVFSFVPLIPMYGNFEISEDKLIYWGLVEKHMDPQRILNYTESRKVSEGSLAPRAKKWMTAEQAAGNLTTLQTMNTNNDPVQLYKHVADQPPPFETGGAQINPGLSETSQGMARYMETISGRINPSGDPTLGLQSGLALQTLQNKGDTGNFSYFTAAEVAIAHTCRVCIDAAPRVYDGLREIQLDEQDGTSKTITINQRVYDEETRQVIELNDLSKGSYSVVCSSGPAFQNRQQETVTAIESIAKIDPTIIQEGGDVLLANIPAPGMDKLAARRRARMITQGLIPEEQLTEEEKKQVQAQQAQQQEPSAMDQALLAEAAASTKESEAKVADTMSKIEERTKKTEMDLEQMRISSENADGKLEIERNKLVLQAMEATNKEVKDMADTLKAIGEALGKEAIIKSPATKEAFDKQAESLTKAIETSE